MSFDVTAKDVERARQNKASAEDVLTTLKSIDRWLEMLCNHFGAGPVTAANRAEGRGNTVPDIAPDRDLDGQHGNPEVKAKDPRDWSGDSQKGKRFSECPPAYLDLVADRLAYFASQLDDSDEGDDLKKARFNRLDAARARGWAARLRAGWKAPEQPAPDDAFGTTTTGAPLSDDDIPFAWLLPFVLPAVGLMGAALHYAA